MEEVLFLQSVFAATLRFIITHRLLYVVCPRPRKEANISSSANPLKGVEWSRYRGKDVYDAACGCPGGKPGSKRKSSLRD
ncbi:hypothetical protein BMJ22_32360 [Sinorhizobium medicae]|nr:hypothetical protein BMJ22_32360 [Sinorhizobium medicae]